MTDYKGQCHCGQTTWTAKVSDEKHVLCHCTACKVLGGGEFTLNQIIPKENFKLTGGDLKQYTYRGDSGNSVDCFYCPNCTSHPYHHQHIMGNKIVIRTSLLKDTEKWGKPAAEIYGVQKWSWQPQTADSIFDTTPPS